jgi:hypothetical protein
MLDLNVSNSKPTHNIPVICMDADSTESRKQFQRKLEFNGNHSEPTHNIPVICIDEDTTESQNRSQRKLDPNVNHSKPTLNIPKICIDVDKTESQQRSQHKLDFNVNHFKPTNNKPLICIEADRTESRKRTHCKLDPNVNNSKPTYTIPLICIEEDRTESHKRSHCTPDPNVNNSKATHNIPVVCIDMESPESKKRSQRKLDLNVNHFESTHNIPVICIDVDSRPETPTANEKIDIVQSINNTTCKTIESNNISSCKPTQMSIESQDPDDLMLQLEKLFRSDSKEDDLFESTLCDTVNTNLPYNNGKKENGEKDPVVVQDSVMENYAARIKSIDEKLASLTGMLVQNSDSKVLQEKVEIPNNKKNMTTSKWQCEEYFLKSKYFEVLDEIGDNNRKKHGRVNINLSHSIMLGNSSFVFTSVCLFLILI